MRPRLKDDLAAPARAPPRSRRRSETPLDLRAVPLDDLLRGDRRIPPPGSGPHPCAATSARDSHPVRPSSSYRWEIVRHASNSRGRLPRGSGCERRDQAPGGVMGREGREGPSTIRMRRDRPPGNDERPGSTFLTRTSKFLIDVDMESRHCGFAALIVGGSALRLDSWARPGRAVGRAGAVRDPGSPRGGSTCVRHRGSWRRPSP